MIILYLIWFDLKKIVGICVLNLYFNIIKVDFAPVGDALRACLVVALAWPHIVLSEIITLCLALYDISFVCEREEIIRFSQAMGKTIKHFL